MLRLIPTPLRKLFPTIKIRKINNKVKSFQEFHYIYPKMNMKYSTFQNAKIFESNKHKFQEDRQFIPSFEKKYGFVISEILSLFKAEKFLRFMNENYRMLPFLFSPIFIKNVMKF